MSEFEFASNGAATLLAGGKGNGTWTATGPDTFSYRILEELTEAQGTVEIAQDAVVRGDEFISSGLTKVRLADGRTVREAHIRITAKRVRRT